MLSEVWNKISYSSVVEMDKLSHSTIYMDRILIHAGIKVMTVHLLLYASLYFDELFSWWYYKDLFSYDHFCI